MGAAINPCCVVQYGWASLAVAVVVVIEYCQCSALTAFCRGECCFRNVRHALCGAAGCDDSVCEVVGNPIMVSGYKAVMGLPLRPGPRVTGLSVDYSLINCGIW